MKWNAATLKPLFKPPGTLNWDEFQHHMQNPAVKVGEFWGLCGVLVLTHPETFGKMIQLDEHSFSDGLVEPPTRREVMIHSM